MLELLLRLGNSLPVVRVNHKYKTLRVLEIVPPEGSNLVLSADVPYCEADVFVLDRLDVEACKDNTTSKGA
jgi:hypothetical protein